MKRLAFITGIAGFAGSYLAEELLRAGYRVFGVLMPGESTVNLSGCLSDLELAELDIQDAAGCRRLLTQVKPQSVWHLAALASVGSSFQVEREVFRVNVEGTLNILQASRDLPNLRRWLFVSSPDCYGLFKPKNKTLTERQPLAPISPYGISKAAAEQLCLLHHRSSGLPVIVARAFNHTGPRQNRRFAVPAFAYQIAAIEVGLQRPVIAVGNLSARRDLSDVRDIVRGYRLLMEKGRPGEVYHLCSGHAVAMKTVLDRLLKLSVRKIRVNVDRSRLRAADLPTLRGSNAKAVQGIGFDTRYTLQRTLKETLDYWRDRVAGQQNRAASRSYS